MPNTRLARPILLLSSLLLSSNALAQQPLDLLDASYTDILRWCQSHPDYKVGGAATGECLSDQSARLEHEVLAQQQDLLTDHCPAIKLRAAIAQQQWQTYRNSQCGLFQAMLDNTAMYNNAAACRLHMTLDFRDQQAFLAHYQPDTPVPCDASP